MSTQNKDDRSVLVREGDATSSLSRRNFIGATAVAVGGLLTAAAALADEQPLRRGHDKNCSPRPRPLSTKDSKLS